MAIAGDARCVRVIGAARARLPDDFRAGVGMMVWGFAAASSRLARGRARSCSAAAGLRASLRAAPSRAVGEAVSDGARTIAIEFEVGAQGRVDASALAPVNVSGFAGTAHVVR